MKRFLFFLIAGLTLLCANTTNAQTDTSARPPKLTPEQRAQKQTDAMCRSLLLSPEQQAQVRGINLKYAQQNAQLRKDTSALKSSNEAKRAELQKVLNPAQYEKYLRMEKQMKKKMRERMEERPVPLQ